MTTNTIQTHYHDALFFASAYQYKHLKQVYLTPSDFKLIIKLISYCAKEGFTTYQNKDIAKHIFLAETTVKDSVESLLKMGYISSELDVYHNNNTWASKRTIYINWDFIQRVLDMIPINEESGVRHGAPIIKTGIEEPISISPGLTQPQTPLPEENNTIINTTTMTRQDLINAVTRELRYAPAGAGITPATFKTLTRGYFDDMDLNFICEAIKPITKENPEAILEAVAYLTKIKNQLKAA